MLYAFRMYYGLAPFILINEIKSKDGRDFDNSIPPPPVYKSWLHPVHCTNTVCILVYRYCGDKSLYSSMIYIAYYNIILYSVYELMALRFEIEFPLTANGIQVSVSGYIILLLYRRRRRRRVRITIYNIGSSYCIVFMAFPGYRVTKFQV